MNPLLLYKRRVEGGPNKIGLLIRSQELEVLSLNRF